MYIRNVRIQNIRSIEDFSMRFENPAGWHVIIGDNGSGKTTIAKAIALGLLSGEHIEFLGGNWHHWTKKGAHIGSIQLMHKHQKGKIYMANIEFVGGLPQIRCDEGLIETKKNCLFASFGALRRFTGGNEKKEEIFEKYPNLGAHLSLFNEDVALSGAIPFLKYLYVRKLEKKKPESLYLDLLVKFINEGKLLPYGAQIKQVTYDDIFFIDGNGQEVTVLEMSDGFRSILSLTLELIRQLVRVYGLETVFEYVEKGENIIKKSGVVIIDEIDAHLHPTWQVKVGEWFLKYFPDLQFIVTTHSPLICRASHRGTIWRLASPASDRPSGEVTGAEKDRLVYGNILDAYGTEVFGEGIERSEEGRAGLERLAYLNKKSIYDKQGLTAQEQEEYERLKQIFQTDAIFDL